MSQESKTIAHENIKDGWKNDLDRNDGECVLQDSADAALWLKQSLKRSSLPPLPEQMRAEEKDLTTQIKRGEAINEKTLKL